MYIQNALIHFYSGCDQMGYAYKVFDKMPEKDVVSWTSVINGLVDNKRPMDGLRLFKRMEMEGFGPNDVIQLYTCSFKMLITELSLLRVEPEVFLFFIFF
ncbi:putative tetratricopeptide-like helical domain superfamily [Helianthus annuus]|nr:putative tetratricopeptide-like helical domain superfamily [Helianthus annuus]